MSMPTSLAASRLSDLARRLRRLTSMDAASTTKVLDALMREVTMEPEAVTAGLGAGDDGGRLGQTKAAPGVVDLRHEDVEVARRDGAQSGLPARTDGEGELPGVPAQLESQVEHGGRRGGRIGRVSR